MRGREEYLVPNAKAFKWISLLSAFCPTGFLYKRLNAIIVGYAKRFRGPGKGCLSFAQSFSRSIGNHGFAFLIFIEKNLIAGFQFKTLTNFHRNSDLPIGRHFCEIHNNQSLLFFRIQVFLISVLVITSL